MKGDSERRRLGLSSKPAILVDSSTVSVPVIKLHNPLPLPDDLHGVKGECRRRRLVVNVRRVNVDDVVKW